MGQLDFELEQQQRDNWCWAAVAAGVANFQRDPKTWGQCDVANAALSRDTCCVDGEPCDVDQSLRDALNAVQHLNATVESAISYENVCAELDANRPLAIRIESGSLGHFVVISGYESGSSDRRLTIDDPGYGRGRTSVPYETVLSNYYGSGRWTHTYYVR